MTTIELRLLDAACEDESGDSLEEKRLLLLRKLDNPEWDKTDTMYDWRRHVNPICREYWNDLCLETRLAEFISAAYEAACEWHED